MLPKLVVINVTNAEVGSIVFRNEIIPKNSINKADEKKPPKSNCSYLIERGDRGIEFRSRNHSQIDGPREDVALEEYT